MDVGTEETVKSSPLLPIHETAESRAPRKDLPMPSQTLFRSVPHKRMLCTVLFVSFSCLLASVCIMSQLSKGFLCCFTPPVDSFGALMMALWIAG